MPSLVKNRYYVVEDCLVEIKGEEVEGEVSRLGASNQKNGRNDPLRFGI